MTWRDVFDDLDRKEKSVRSVIEDPSCRVGKNEIRSELSERCSARDMAELAVFREICGHVKSGSRRYYVPPESGGQLIPGVDYPGYAESLDSEHRHQWIEALDSEAEDQEAYWAKRAEVDTLLLRTAWLRSRCVAGAGSSQSWSRRDAAILMSHSASLGDGFALAHDRGTRERAFRLLEIHPIQAYVNLALFDAELVNEEWKQADADARRVAKAPYMENRRELLSMSGVDCPAPCTSEQLDEIETSTHMHVQFQWAQCGLTRDCSEESLKRRDELRAPLIDIDLELARTHEARSLPYRKRAEMAKASYVLAIKMVAEEKGVEPSRMWLRRISDIDNPQLMEADDLDVALARARALVDQQLETRRSGYN